MHSLCSTSYLVLLFDHRPLVTAVLQNLAKLDLKCVVRDCACASEIQIVLVSVAYILY